MKRGRNHAGGAVKDLKALKSPFSHTSAERRQSLLGY